MVEIQKVVNPKDYEIGVVMARFQGKRMHEGHKLMLDLVCANHNKVIIFLGVPKIGNTRRNPLDFATRYTMVQKLYPNAVILPQHDQRSDAVWSRNLDAQISTPFGEGKALLYGSRDSFIPHYEGKHTTTEVTDIPNVSGTELRDKVATEILPNSSFRAGVIYANYARRPVTYSTVDVAIHNDKGQFLLAKKPHEKHWRFVGGFLDRDDVSDERAAYREAMEETNGCHISNIRYILSQQVDDWRYRREEDGIMTRLFLASFGFGNPKATDDLANGGDLQWHDISYFTEARRIKNEIMPEHQSMMTQLIEKIYTDKMVPNLGEFYVPKVERRDPEAVVEDTTFIPK
tara:strand:- start:23217 stop:24251 length:1035 start_codon:yes stop_codon:yes gene_type:complete